MLFAIPALAQEKSEPKYEMMTYYLVLLKRGPASTAESTPATQRIQEGHMANIRKMAATGKLIVAGPFTDGGDLRGLFLFNVASKEEAQALCDQDPAVQAGRLIAEIHPWFAAKGITVAQNPK